MNNNMNEQNNQGMNNTFQPNGQGQFVNNMGQPANPMPTDNNMGQPVNPMPMNNNAGYTNYVPNNNAINKLKKNNKYIFIIIGVIALVIVLLVIFLGKNKGSGENLEGAQGPSIPGNSVVEKDEESSGTPENATIEKGEIIRVREKNKNVDLKYISYDPDYNEKNVAIRMEFTNKNESKEMVGVNVKLYDSSDNLFTSCYPKNPDTGKMVDLVEPNQTIVVDFVCYIPSTGNKSQIAKARYHQMYIDNRFNALEKTYILNIN